MSTVLDTLHLEIPTRVLIVASNPATSPITGSPIGFWWSELTHPYWEFTERGYAVDIASPKGGALVADRWSDPRDDSGYSVHDLISAGFIDSPSHAKLVATTPALVDVDTAIYDALLLIGGQAPMVTFVDDVAVHGLVREFLESGKPTGVVCHATCVLLKARSSTGELLVADRTWTGFANSEEKYAEDYVGRRIQPFWIEDEARKMEGTNFIVHGRFKPHAVRDGNLITGQQQYSGTAAARLMIEALGA